MIHAHRFKRKTLAKGLIVGTKLVCFMLRYMFCPLHSSTSKKQHEKHLCNLSSHYGKYGNLTHEMCVPHLNTWKPKRLNFSIIELFHIIISRKIVWEGSLWSLCLAPKPLCVYYKSSPISGCKKEWRHKVGTKVAPWCKHCSCCGWWKGTSWDEATLISEKIKSVVLAIVELCLSEGISK